MTVTYSTLYGSDSDDQLSPTYQVDGDDIVMQSTIYGGGGNDRIFGSEIWQSGRYDFYGEEGDDVLEFDNASAKALLSGGRGDDTIYLHGPHQKGDGGAGFDTLYATTSETTLSRSRVTGMEKLVIANTVVAQESVLGDFTTIVVKIADLQVSNAVTLSAENLETTKKTVLFFSGSNKSDAVDLRSLEGSFTIHGEGGNDVIYANNTRTSVDGGGGADLIVGGAGNDELDGGYSSGNNTILGMGGDDIIHYSGAVGKYDGGAGHDTLNIDSYNHTISLAAVNLASFEEIGGDGSPYALRLGGADMSSIRTLSGALRIFLNPNSPLTDVDLYGANQIIGSQGDDIADFASVSNPLIFKGRGGSDRFEIGEGSGTLYGGEGDDYLRGGDGKDRLIGGVGSDTMLGGAGKDWILTGRILETEREIIDCGDGDDLIQIAGNANGSGRISGGDGNDRLYVKGDLGDYRISGIETVVLNDDEKGVLTARADAFNSIAALKTTSPFRTFFFDLTLSAGGEFTWKKASDDRGGTLSDSAGKDIIDFSASKAGWHFKMGAGDDVVTGSSGASWFYFAGDIGHDIIRNFDKGSDSIDIKKTDEIRNTSDLEGRLISHDGDLLIVLDDKISHNYDDLQNFIEVENFTAKSAEDFNIWVS